MIEGLSCREAARRFGVHQNTIAKVLQFLVPLGYQRRERPTLKKLEVRIVWLTRFWRETKAFKRSSVILHFAFLSSYAINGNILAVCAIYSSGSELLFEVFSQRYERGSTLVTSNLPFDEWTSVFGTK